VPENSEQNPTVQAVVWHFAADGLTVRDYLQAADKQYSLIAQRPETLIANIEGVVKHFAAEGLTTRRYLQAAIEKPQLFCQRPTTLISNVEDVVKRFRDQGLTAPDYVLAAVEQPSLFIQRPSTLIGNIEGVVEYFAAEGLTTRDFLQAAIKQPQLFYQKPETLIANIESVKKHFAAYGLTTHEYLQAALKQPSLFVQKPSTIIGHANLIESLHNEGILAIDQGKPALLAFILKYPRYLSLADDNFHLREIAARTTNSQASLHVPRKDVESHLATALGYPDMKMPAPKIDRPDSPGADLGPHARNLLLRALIHEGYLKGKSGRG
jgi:hypothetical protein